MEEVFGKFRSGNALKNIWYSKKRQLERAAKAKEVEESSSDESEIEEIEYEDESEAGSFKHSIQFLSNWHDNIILNH